MINHNFIIIIIIIILLLITANWLLLNVKLAINPGLYEREPTISLINSTHAPEWRLRMRPETLMQMLGYDHADAWMCLAEVSGAIASVFIGIYF